MKNVIGAINELKSLFVAKDLKDVSVLSKIRDQILLDHRFEGVFAAQYLVADIENCIHKKSIVKLNASKFNINSGTDDLVFSLFSAPYFEELSIDGFFYQEIQVPLTLKEKIYSPACPVKMIEASHGFSSETVVALFPEKSY